MVCGGGRRWSAAVGVVVLAVAVTSCSGHKFDWRSCVDVDPLQNFDWNSYTNKTWYVIKSYAHHQDHCLRIRIEEDPDTDETHLVKITVKEGGDNEDSFKRYLLHPGGPRARASYKVDYSSFRKSYPAQVIAQGVNWLLVYECSEATVGHYSDLLILFDSPHSDDIRRTVENEVNGQINSIFPEVDYRPFTSRMVYNEQPRLDLVCAWNVPDEDDFSGMYGFGMFGGGDYQYDGGNDDETN